MKISTITSLCLALAFANPTAAVVISYNDAAGYAAAVGTELFALNFDSEPQGAASSGNFVGLVDFGSPESITPDEVFFNSLAMTDMGSTVAANFVGPINGVFANTVKAFSLAFSSSGNAQTIDLFDVGNVLFASAVSNPGGFFGVSSAIAIKSFLIRNGEFSPGNRDRYFIDNFAANAFAMPEPAISSMFVIGLIAMGLTRKITS